MAPSFRWSNHVAPFTAVIPCGGEQHRVTWRRGKLVLEDHDLAAERAMIALGGQACDCMRALKMWRDQWVLPPEMLRDMSWLGPNAFLAPTELDLPRQLGRVRNWERAWRRDSYTSRLGQLLEDDVRRLATDALRRFVARGAEQLGSPLTPMVTVHLTTAGQRPTLVGRVEGRRAKIDAHLGGAWIVTVWGWNASVVDDGFILELSDDPRSMVVRAARWEKGPDGFEPTVRVARLVPGESTQWSLEWEKVLVV